MQFNRKLSLLIILILAILSPIVLYAKYWRSNVRIPSGWITYVNMQGYRYSFAHPKEWIVVECRDMGVIVVKKRVNKCYFPLEASKEYLDNLYFQVFLPGHHAIRHPANEREFVLPDKLKNWESVSWYRRDDLPFGFKDEYRWIGSQVIPVQAVATDSTHELIVGHIYHATHSKDFRQVLNSFRHY